MKNYILLNENEKVEIIKDAVYKRVYEPESSYRVIAEELSEKYNVEINHKTLTTQSDKILNEKPNLRAERERILKELREEKKRNEKAKTQKEKNYTPDEFNLDDCVEVDIEDLDEDLSIPEQLKQYAKYNEATVEVTDKGDIKRAWLRIKDSEKFNNESFKRVIKEEVKPKILNLDYRDSDELIVIPYNDLHFGINKLKDYEAVLEQTAQLLSEKHRDKILLIIGSDVLHHDNFKGKTANETRVEDVDIIQAFKDASVFYSTILEVALKNSNEVEAFYIRGNHDESLSFALVQKLQAIYSQVKFDIELYDHELEKYIIPQRKAVLYGENFIGFSHGDTVRKNKYPTVFMSEFRKLYGQCTNADVYLGHLHHEQTIDADGVTLRQTSTASKTDSWHKEKGFTTSHRRFMIPVYDKFNLKSVHYINAK